MEGPGSKQRLESPDWAQKNVVYKGMLDHMVGLMVLQGFDPFEYPVNARGLEKSVLSQKMLGGVKEESCMTGPI